MLWPNLRKNFVNELEQYHATPQTETPSNDGAFRLLTVDELALFDGVTNKQLYLSILGSVYDVSKGQKHYGPDGTYNYFVGEFITLLAFIVHTF